MVKLIAIQSELKAPKNQFNDFGKYKYRSVEDILEAVKPLLEKHGCLLTITDDIIECGGRIYIHAMAVFADGEQFKEVSAYAREAETKKGMDEAQITGSASSYARKYALNGLFLIDDTKDPDATNKHEDVKPELKESTPAFKRAIDVIAKGGDWEKVEAVYAVSPKVKESINNAVEAQNAKP